MPERTQSTQSTEPTKAELESAPSGSFDTDVLRFAGLRGDRRRHLDRAALIAGLAGLTAPLDEGTVELLVARGPSGERHVHDEARLTVQQGMPGDRWSTEAKYGPEYQLATTRADVARLIANGQPLELHGDNLFLQLDLSARNLPAGTLVRAGGAILQVTPQPHNGCKKWVQRFGLSAMQLNLDPAYREVRLRGMYFRVIEDGLVRVGDRARVIERPRSSSA